MTRANEELKEALALLTAYEAGGRAACINLLGTSTVDRDRLVLALTGIGQMMTRLAAKADDKSTDEVLQMIGRVLARQGFEGDTE